MSTPQRPHLPPGVLEALKQGNKIEAIRLLRESTKMGLAETKAMVEMLGNVKQSVASKPNGPVRMHARVQPQVHLPLRRPGLSPGEVPRHGSGVMGIIVVLAIGFAVAYSLVR